MRRDLIRSSSSEPTRRDRADHRGEPKVSAITGHVDYLELAERVVQGVTVEHDMEPHRQSRKARRR